VADRILAAARLERLAESKLYLCTDARREQGDLADFLDAVLAGGVDIVQLREKGLEAREELAYAEVFAAAAARHSALWSINDRADLALGADAPVLHLGQDDLPVPVARAIIGPRPLIGRSTHDAEQVARAVAEEVDYFCVGPCWPTPTKPGRPSPGLDLVRATAEMATKTPWFAIGGIDEQRLPEVLAAGARRIVVVRAITGAEDPKAAAQRLRTRLAEAG
jgi:thiamine-phosphate pyrophosphorylase